MIKRLEQVAALVVAAGLAIVSYWLFFSWAQGGAPGPRHEKRQSLLQPSSEPASGLDQPLAGGAVVDAGQMVANLVGADRQAFGRTDLDDATQGATGIL